MGRIETRYGEDESACNGCHDGTRDADKLALEFMATDDKEAFLAKVKPETEKHIEGELYYLMMEKIIKKGDGYAAKESARLGRIIQKGSITRTKFADMVLKVNVLDAFLDTESS